MDIDITGIDKAELLAALYNNARPLGMGFLQARATPMTREDAAELLKRTPYFDYLYGRPLKIDLRGSTMGTELYDRDQGDGEAERIVKRLRGER